MDDPRVTTERRHTPRESIPSRFLTFTRAEWAPLRANTPLTLSDADLERVAGGKQDITANCLVLGGTAVSNTVMQLNL